MFNHKWKVGLGRGGVPPPVFKSGGTAPPDFEIENQFVYFVRLRSDRHLDVLTIILFPIISTAKTNNSITVIVSLRFYVISFD